ncbi:WD40 repeat domain-containing protein [Paenibacillus dokdonensis]|uniref:WD40 repeat domain-containing protein n=1 Tax=Paenibacillus dokdonensis TaxID=2567944 RepID=A0ABU6GV76_9BACL|nr:WD40 repeat domain-containing protein [Paenibacillus dokdonensis]MEC0242620.1 WD40 repeat domain-containing protein [Paenibacillus dokdonensis]
MMTNKRFIRMSTALLILIVLMSGCTHGQRSETIVIPSTEENHTSDQGSRSFQVKTIYRLPASVTDNDEMLGWSAPDTVIGLFKIVRSSERMKRNLQRISIPYENLTNVQNVDINTHSLELSPDGKYISGITKTQDGDSLTVISLSDGQHKEVARFNSREQLLVQKLSWSSDSRYLSYLFTDSNSRQESLGIYDTDADITKDYHLTGFENTGNITSVKISDDGRSMLFTMVQSSRKSSVVLGIINGSEVDVQYEHQTGGEQIAWLNNEQFVYLGTEGTLYEYDRRNSELSVLLENVERFEFSQNRKYIAYSLNEKDSIFAGKLQGKNILYEEPVYHGINPSQMLWSPDNNSLLVNGEKIYSRLSRTPMVASPSDHQPFIIKFQ